MDTEEKHPEFYTNRGQGNRNLRILLRVLPRTCRRVIKDRNYAVIESRDCY